MSAYFAEVEQSAFNPANVVPGIGFSPDRMLQGRLFSYGDTQRYRLGVNHGLLPVNKPRCPFHSAQRDGAMRSDANGGAEPNYEPNGRGGPRDNPSLVEPPLHEAFGGTIARYDHRVDDDYCSQPGALYRLMNDAQRDALVGNIARHMASVDADIQQRAVELFTRVDGEYGARLARALEQQRK